MSGHTSGPWVVSFHGPYNASIDAEGGSLTVAVLDCEPEDAEAKAALVPDAKLIAAAPEMAGALLNCLDELGGRHCKHVDVEAVKAILRNAGVLP